MFHVWIHDDYYKRATEHDVKNLIYEEAYKKGLPKEDIVVIAFWTGYDFTDYFTRYFDIYPRHNIKGR